MQARNAQLNVLLLISASILARSTSIAVLAVSSLVAFDLTGDARLATLPMAMTMVTDTLLKIPAAYFMQRFGRRAGFTIGAGAAVVSALLAAAAVARHQFMLFIAAAMVYGIYAAFNLYYAFAAAEAVEVARRARAISWVVGAGIVAAFVGPALARLSDNESASGYQRVFMVLAAVGLLAVALLTQLRLAPAARLAPGQQARPLGELLRQPAFLTAVMLSSAGFAVMTSIMGTTPLAMKLCNFPLAASATVIQWHMLGMFLPSLFTGELIRRIGLMQVLASGVLLVASAVMVAVSGQSLAHFAMALAVLGVGWNFLFIGGSALLLETIRPGEQAKAQGCYDFSVLTVASLTSLSAGPVLAAGGWQALTTFTSPLLLLALVLLAWCWRIRSLARQGAPE